MSILYLFKSVEIWQLFIDGVYHGLSCCNNEKLQFGPHKTQCLCVYVCTMSACGNKHKHTVHTN